MNDNIKKLNTFLAEKSLVGVIGAMESSIILAIINSIGTHANSIELEFHLDVSDIVIIATQYPEHEIIVGYEDRNYWVAYCDKSRAKYKEREVRVNANYTIGGRALIEKLITKYLKNINYGNRTNSLAN